MEDSWDLAHSWDLNLGFQTNAGIGLSGRLGDLNSPFWSTPYDPINRGNFVPAMKGDELYVWAAGRLRGVAYDALLQGQFRDSEVTVDYDDMRQPGVGGGDRSHQGLVGVSADLLDQCQGGRHPSPRGPRCAPLGRAVP